MTESVVTVAPREAPKLYLCGLDFEFRGYHWDSRALSQSVRLWVCPKLHAEVRHYESGDWWGVWLHRGRGTGKTAREALERAYADLDQKSDEITTILNAVHERLEATRG